MLKLRVRVANKVDLDVERMLFKIMALQLLCFILSLFLKNSKGCTQNGYLSIISLRRL